MAVTTRRVPPHWWVATGDFGWLVVVDDGDLMVGNDGCLMIVDGFGGFDA